MARIAAVIGAGAGADAGVGRATAVEFARQGDDPALVSRDRACPEAAAADRYLASQGSSGQPAGGPAEDGSLFEAVPGEDARVAAGAGAPVLSLAALLVAEQRAP